MTSGKARRALNGDEVPTWLEGWPDIAHSRWKDLLLGNGSSISISDAFSYRTLRELAARRSEPPLSDDSVRIFEALGHRTSRRR